MASENVSITEELMQEQADDAQPTLREKAQKAGEVMREFGQDAREKASQKLHELKDEAAEYLEEGRRRSIEAEHHFEEYVQSRPIQSIAIAAAAGLVIGLLLRR